MKKQTNFRKLFARTILITLLAMPAMTRAGTLFSQGFNDSTTPTGWAVETVVDPDSDAAITYVTSSLHPTGFNPYEGTRFVRFNSFTCDSGDSIRLKRTTSFSTVGSSGVSINFAWTEDDMMLKPGEGVRVQWSLDGTSWNNGDFYLRYNSAGDAWHNEFYSLPAGALGQSTVYIAFLFVSEYGNDCYLDDLVVFSASPNDGTWINTEVNTPKEWNATANWSGGTVAGGVGKTASFNNGIDTAGALKWISVSPVPIGPSPTIDDMEFSLSSDDPSALYAIGNGTLTLVGTPTIDVAGIDNLAGVYIGYPGQGGEIAGTVGFTKTGTGRLYMAQPSTISGPVNINAGILEYKDANGLQNADVVINNTAQLVPSGNMNANSITINSGGRIKVQGGSPKSVGGSSITVANGGEVGFFDNFFTYTISNPLVLEGYGIAPSLGSLTVQGVSSLTNNSPITLAGNTRIGMWGGGDESMIMNGVISGTGLLNLHAQGGDRTHIRRFELHAANDYTGNTIIQGLAAQNITTLYGNNRLPNTTLTLELTSWSQDLINTFNLNGYDQDLQQLVINAGANLDEIKIIGGGGTINAAGVGNYGALMNGNAVSLHDVTFDAGGSIIAMRNNIELTVIDSTVRTTGYILMNHGPLNSYLNVGEDGLVDVKLLRLADTTDPLNLSPVVNLNAGGTIKTSWIWIDGTTSPTAIFRFNGGTLENHGSSTYDNNWIVNDHSTVVADGGANISVDRDITIPAPLLHDPTASAVDGGLTKLGSGTLTLSSEDNNYTGPTTVSAGKLIVNGDISDSSSITVASGATVGGTGTLPATTIPSAATVSPGNSIGTLDTGALTMEAGSEYDWEYLDPESDADSIDADGTLTLPPAVNSVTVNVDFVKFQERGNFTLISSTGISGGGADPEEVFYADGEEDDNIEFTRDGNNIMIHVAPEPGMFLGLILAGFAILRKRF